MQCYTLFLTIIFNLNSKKATKNDGRKFVFKFYDHFVYKI